jgi:hypothetical protein
MFDRLTNLHQLHNLIWVWSTPETEWYPGNEMVDIIGHDSYPGSYNYGNQKNTFDRLFQVTNGEKLIAMTENGPIPDPDECLLYDAPWSYFMAWSDLVLAQNTTSHIADVYANSNVLSIVTAPTYKINFSLINSITKEKLENVPVVFNLMTKPTDAEGKVTFYGTQGNYSYSVSKANFRTESGSITLSADMNKVLQMVQNLGDVNFKVLSGGVPLENAEVILNNHEKVTNSSGLATYLSVLLSTSYPYSITKTGYIEQSGFLQPESDTIIEINLELNTVGIGNDKINQIQIWPNPVSDYLNCKFPVSCINKTVTITDLPGNLLYSEKLLTTEIKINIQNYQAGAYLIKVATGSEFAGRLFIKE